MHKSHSRCHVINGRSCLALLMILIFVCSSLTGCGKKDNSSVDNPGQISTQTPGSSTNQNTEAPTAGIAENTSSESDSTGADNGLASVPEDTAPKDKSGRYTLSEANEAVIDDVDMTHLVNQTDADNNRVFYEIFVGSFSDSNGDGIGDLRGIINRMDYLNDGDPKSGLSLGVEGIWLSPIFSSPSYHKYDTTDYYTIDKKFGTMDDLKELVALCHERNVKIILDMVINHSGSQNKWFSEFVKARRDGNTDSEYYDFYSTGSTVMSGSRVFSKITGTNEFYECNFSGSMPELNYENEFVYRTILDVARYYLEEVGVDGFRFDAAKYIFYGEEARNVEFWSRFMGDLKAIKPDIYTVGEVWSADSVTTMYAPALNCFNFSMSQVDGKISSTSKKGDVNKFASYIESFLKTIDVDNLDTRIIPFISNHDMDRAAGYMTYASGLARVAANLYILGPGSPFIYYGEEIAMKGSRGAEPTDANRRLAMLWGDEDTIKDPEGTTFDSKKQTNGTVAGMKDDGNALYNYYKRLIMLRRANPEIAGGSYHALSLAGTKLGGFVSTMAVAGGTAPATGASSPAASQGGYTSVMVIHNTTDSVVTYNLADAVFTDDAAVTSLIDLSSTSLFAIVGMEEDETMLDGTTLTIGAQTSVIIR